MSEISVKFIADQLGKDIENATPNIIDQINQAVGDLANAAYASMISNAQAQLHSSRQDYISGLEFTKLGDNSFLISLSGKMANALEDGYGPFDMKPGMLNSKKIVGVGSRSGQPWVQHSQKGTRYAAVPFEHHPFQGGKTGDLEADIKKLLAFNRQGKLQKITKIFKDDLGKPLAGKVATAHNATGNLEGLVKFQHVSEKGTTSSVYMTWRMISDNSIGWQHPGFPGIHLFPEAEKYVEKELTNIINMLL